MNAKQWILLITLGVLWGASFFLNEITLTQMQPLTASFIRIAGGACVLIILFPKNHIFIKKQPWKNLAIMGLLNNALPFSLIITAQIHISAGTAAIINAMTPFSTIILAHIMLKDDNMTAQKIIGTLIAVSGLAIVLNIGFANGNTHNIIQKIMVIIATLSYAGAAIFAKLKLNHIPTTHIATGQLIAAAIILLPIILIIETPYNNPAPGINVIAALFAIATFGTAFAYIIYFTLLKSAGATNLSLVTILVPLSALFLDWAILNEKITQNHIIGTAIIALGMAIIDGRPIKKIIRFYK